MADPNNDPLRPERPPGSTNRPRPRPLPEPTPRPETGDSASVLDEPCDPTDDSPTVISKNQPRAGETPGNDLRGRRLAHFDLIEQIGIGGMAAVLRAHDTQLDRDVALKILPPDMAADGENVSRFHQEARSAAKLDHENIARVFFCGEDQGLHFIAFEFVQGENLRTILERRGRLPVAEALPYMVQLAAGLAHAAERGVVHRDIKPSNIIITPSGRAKLVDMGLARSLERREKDLTQSGVTLGTFDYISPEQALEPRDADVRSDIYSLGCTFYHMLTGRPPVPDGTAARKLHHHQHVKPVDPRELAPLPDEIAVVLDRMMAKRAQDRYQTATALLQHLLGVARKLGVSAEAPEGVLFVDAALPRPSRGRPVLLAALAVGAVVALVFLLEPPPPPAPPGATPVRDDKAGDGQRPPHRDGDLVVKDNVAPKRDAQPPQVEQPNPEKKEVTYSKDAPTVKDLAEWSQQHRGVGKMIVELARDLDVVAGAGSPDLVFEAQEVVIRPKWPATRVTIRYSTDFMPARRAALTIDSPKASVEGLRVLVDARGGAYPLTGLLLKGGKAEVRGCDFFQAQPNYAQLERGRLASVVVEATEMSRGRCSLALTECVFLGFKEMSFDPEKPPAILSGVEAGGVDAVVRRGPAAISARDCAFGPHVADFRLEGAGDAAVKVQNCTAYTADQTAVFDLIAGAGAAFDVKHCLFAHYNAPAMNAVGGGVVVRQAGRGDAPFVGSDNGYFKLAAFWAGDGETIDFKEWGKRLADRDPNRSQDPSRLLRSYPSRDPDPLARLKAFACALQFNGPPPGDTETAKVVAAFQVEDRLCDLRQASSAENLIGVEHLHGFPYAGDRARPLPPLDLEKRKQLVVDPLRNDPNSGFYRTLAEAVGVAGPQYEVLLRVDGELTIDEAIELKKKGAVDLVIKPEAGFRPVLTLGEPSERDTALFRLYDGLLRLEGLEVRLRPGRAGFTAQVGVALLGEGQVTFARCLFTLEASNDSPDATLAVVAVADPRGAMMKPPRPQGLARLTFENCFARGQGDLIWGRSARPFEAQCDNVLAALTGSLLVLEVGLDQAPAGEVTAKLKHVTTWLNGPLARLHSAKDAKGFLPLRLEPLDGGNNLFLPAGPTPPPLLRLEGAQVDSDKIKERVTWKAGSNAYGPFQNLLEQSPLDGELAKEPLTQEGWKAFSGERAGKFDAGLAVPIPEGFAWPALLPRQFQPAKELPAGQGAELNRLPLAEAR
jgi:hypothetical protein